HDTKDTLAIVGGRVLFSDHPDCPSKVTRVHATFGTETKVKSQPRKDCASDAPKLCITIGSFLGASQNTYKFFGITSILAVRDGARKRNAAARSMRRSRRRRWHQFSA